MDYQRIMEAAPLAVAILALAVAVLAHRRMAVAHRSLAILQGRFKGQTLLDAVAAYSQEVDSARGVMGAVAARQEELFALLGRSARNLGLVRYDAFEEMGGRLSFSAALLNDHGTGIVISSINARAESRVYAKEVRGGTSDHTLSPEEQQAIAEALGSRRKARR